MDPYVLDYLRIAEFEEIVREDAAQFGFRVESVQLETRERTTDKPTLTIVLEQDKRPAEYRPTVDSAE